MWIRRAAMGMCIVFGVGFGFVLSSCMTPPVDGQATGFPPLAIGSTYAFEGTASILGEVTEIGPYPWVEIVRGDPGETIQVNLNQITFIQAR